MATENKKAVGKRTNTTKVEENVQEIANAVEKQIDYAPTDGVLCRSVTAGELGMIGRKTGTLYLWANCGDCIEVEYQDLKAENLVRSVYLYSPLFVVEDEALLSTKEWSRLNEEVYSKLYSADDIDSFFSLDNGNFKRILMEMPSGMKNTIRSLTATKIQDGSLDSLTKIKIIDEVLDTDFINSYLEAK